MITKPEQVDLFKYPNKTNPLQEGDELTIGDLHGNSIKFLFFLIKQGVLNLKHGEKDYNELVRIYLNTRNPEYIDTYTWPKLDTLKFESSDVTKINEILNNTQNTLSINDINTQIKPILEPDNNSIDSNKKFAIYTIADNRSIKINLENNFDLDPLIQIFKNYSSFTPTNSELEELNQIISQYDDQPENKIVIDLLKTQIPAIINSTQQSNKANIIAATLKDLILIKEQEYRNNIITFKKILNDATFTPKAKSTKIRVLNGELASLGNNDYFTLLILDKFNKHQTNAPKIEIIFSKNNNFVKFYEKYLDKLNFIPENHSYSNKSLFNLISLMNQNMVNSDEIKQIILDSYKPNIKLISYSINNNIKPSVFNIYSHAPIDLTTIENIAKAFNTTYNTASLETLAKSIDDINTHFKTLVKNNQIIDKTYDGRNNIILNAISDIHSERLNRTESCSKEFQIHYINVKHVAEDAPEKYVTNLSDHLGQAYDHNNQNNSGTYTIEITNFPTAIPEDFTEDDNGIIDLTKYINELHEAINNSNESKVNSILNQSDIKSDLLELIHFEGFENQEKITALQLAVEKNNINIINIILNKMNNIINDSDSPQNKNFVLKDIEKALTKANQLEIQKLLKEAIKRIKPQDLEHHNTFTPLLNRVGVGNSNTINNKLSKKTTRINSK